MLIKLQVTHSLCTMDHLNHLVFIFNHEIEIFIMDVEGIMCEKIGPIVVIRWFCFDRNYVPSIQTQFQYKQPPLPPYQAAPYNSQSPSSQGPQQFNLELCGLAILENATHNHLTSHPTNYNVLHPQYENPFYPTPQVPQDVSTRGSQFPNLKPSLHNLLITYIHLLYHLNLNDFLTLELTTMSLLTFNT